MNYDDVISELNTIINSEFGMQHLLLLRKMYILMNRIYRRELLKENSDKKACTITFEKYIRQINNTIWNKLKEELMFEDKVINHIISVIKHNGNIKGLYVLDGNVIALSNDNQNEVIHYFSKKSFKDITHDSFIENNAFNSLTKFVIKSINNAIKPLIDNSPKTESVINVDFNNLDSDLIRLILMEKDLPMKFTVQSKSKQTDLLNFDNGKVNYGIDGLKVYISRNMSDILTDNTGTKITKILVYYNDFLYSYDMKIRNDFVILTQDNNEVKVVSQILNEKANQKIKK